MGKDNSERTIRVAHKYTSEGRINPNPIFYINCSKGPNAQGKKVFKEYLETRDFRVGGKPITDADEIIRIKKELDFEDYKPDGIPDFEVTLDMIQKEIKQEIDKEIKRLEEMQKERLKQLQNPKQTPQQKPRQIYRGPIVNT